ncbi:MAG TPA: AraC family transcriptional regulator [Gemmatimonadaceae bacterium]|nr:AraC family transcriptional regulator [Gemmatimonadaceae bacterium]
MLQLAHGEFLGQGAVIRQTDDLLFFETSHAANVRLPRHAHDHPYFCFVISGSVMEVSRGHSRSCPPGTVVFNPADTEHSDDIGGRGCRCFVIQLDPAWSSARFEAERWPDWVTVSGDVASSLAARLRREARVWEPTSPMVVEGILLLLSAEALRTDRRHGERTRPDWVTRAAQRLDAEFRSPPSVQQLALDAGVHPAYFARSFRSFLGCTPGTYARQRRLAWARAMLTAGRPLIEVALEAGFADQAHFSREFKRTEGVTPSDFRRSLPR